MLKRLAIKTRESGGREIPASVDGRPLAEYGLLLGAMLPECHYIDRLLLWLYSN